MIDDISRIIASPIPRRRALRMVSGVVGGGILTFFSLGRARAQEREGCPRNTTRCGFNCCTEHEFCCGGTCYGIGVRDLNTCCGTMLCRNSSQHCCTNHCCSHSQTCCGFGCCGERSHCCGDRTCCPEARACCSGTCCNPRAICCGGACCPEGHFCCSGRCVRTRPSTSAPCIAV